MDLGLRNKVVVITGANTGIGKATALAFAREGAHLVIDYLDHPQIAADLAKDIMNLRAHAMTIRADITKPADVRRLFSSSIQQYGHIDILVNNAGISIPKPFADLTGKDWLRTLSVNTIGTFLCAQEVAQHMALRKSGAIINLASVRGIPECGREASMDYGASKAAVISFTKTLAKELAPHVRVNAVAPGIVDTDMIKATSESYRNQAKKQHYLRRFAKPDEIADSILFLASARASFITGHVLVVDGGYTLK